MISKIKKHPYFTISIICFFLLILSNGHYYFYGVDDGYYGIGFIIYSSFIFALWGILYFLIFIFQKIRNKTESCCHHPFLRNLFILIGLILSILILIPIIETEVDPNINGLGKGITELVGILQIVPLNLFLIALYWFVIHFLDKRKK